MGSRNDREGCQPHLQGRAGQGSLEAVIGSWVLKDNAFCTCSWCSHHYFSGGAKVVGSPADARTQSGGKRREEAGESVASISTCPGVRDPLPLLFTPVVPKFHRDPP